jgi:aspartate--ammonia ligase
MSKLTIPKNYSSALNLHDTQLAIKTVKDFFQGMLAQRLSLTRVSAPLFVDPTTGLNDNLNGYERPVTFGILEQGDKEAEVVHSLAKWKRYALKKYGFSLGVRRYETSIRLWQPRWPRPTRNCISTARKDLSVRD